MSQTRTDRRTDEQGIAMIVALFAVAILGGLAVLFMATSMNQLRFTENEREWERALPTGEAGVDQVILELNREKEFYGNAAANDSTAEAPIYDPNVPPPDERAWAIEMTDGAASTTTGDPGAFTVTSIPGGDIASFRPRPPDPDFDQTAEICTNNDPEDDEEHICGVNTIFAVGYIPDRGTALAGDGEIRVLKIDYDQSRFKPDFALASAGNCDMTSGVVGGIKGDVYCDNDIEDGTRGNGTPALEWGNTAKVEGKLIATGNIDPDPGIRADSCDFENSCANGTVESFEENAVHQELPGIDVRDAYSLHHSMPGGLQWFDLCPPGTPDTRATIRSPSGTPCTGSLVWTDGETNNFNGWDWTGAAGKWKGSSISSGAYYVYRANADSQGSQPDAEVSVFVEADPSDNGSTGNWGISGNIDVSPAAGDQQILFLADRDIIMNGNSGSVFDGFIGAHEQVDARGSARLNGSIYAENAPHTPNSPVDETELSGSMEIHYNVDLAPFLTGIVRITAWQEL